MDFYGNINLKDNEIQNLVFEQETSFPVDATVGSIVFKNNTLYMCVALNVADPIWIPLTASIDTYVYEQEATATTWTVTHNLGEENLILQVYNDANEMVIPDSVTPTDTNEIIVTFSTAIAGRVIVMFGDEIPANGIGIIDPVVGWVISDISLSTYDSINTTVLAAAISGIFFNGDGTRLYVIGSTNNRVYQYGLSVGFDLSTVSYSNDFYNSTTQDTIPTGVEFNTDGTKMYIIGDGNNHVYEYDLGTAWDLTSTVYNSISLNIGSQESKPAALAFNTDGTKMYIVGESSDTVHQYTLSSAWDLSTASYDSISFSVGNEESKPNGVTFNTSGTQMFIVGITTSRVYQYTLSSAWDLSTASYDSKNFIVTSIEQFPRTLKFSNNGAKLYIAGTDSNEIHQYSTNI